MIGYTEIIPRSKKTKNHELNNKKVIVFHHFSSHVLHVPRLQARRKKNNPVKTLKKLERRIWTSR